MLIDGVLTAISCNAAALALSASTTNYVEATRAGVVSKNTTGFTAGSIPLYHDRYRRIDRHQLHRSTRLGAAHLPDQLASVAVTTADYT